MFTEILNVDFFLLDLWDMLVPEIESHIIN